MDQVATERSALSLCGGTTYEGVIGGAFSEDNSTVIEANTPTGQKDSVRRGKKMERRLLDAKEYNDGMTIHMLADIQGQRKRVRRQTNMEDYDF